MQEFGKWNHLYADIAYCAWLFYVLFWKLSYSYRYLSYRFNSNLIILYWYT